jgi:hypothetical protein
MDKYIDGRFERLEKALAVLVDSVNKYHPSIAHAKEIELADSELSKGLEDGTRPRQSPPNLSDTRH